MSIGLLIVTHNKIGADILATAKDIIGKLPLAAEVVEIKPDSNYDDKLQEAKELVKKLDSGDGVLVLTDIFGATPSNIANKAINGRNARVVTGINLAMVVRTLNYHRLPLVEIANKASSAGHDSILTCDGN